MEYPDFSNASCVGLDINLFYKEDDGKSNTRYPDYEIIRKVCMNCACYEDCLTWALHHENDGIWAGTTEYQRRTMRNLMGIKYKNLSVLSGAK